MSNMTTLKLRALILVREFFQVIWFHPSAWLYWDEKVLKARKDAKSNG